MLYIFLRTDAVVPDELEFYSYIKSMDFHGFQELLFMPNTFGYGSLYWVFLFCLGDLKWIRIFSFLCLSITPLGIWTLQKYIFHKGDKTIFLSMLVFLSCPLAWFTGKIIGPELIGNAIGIGGICVTLFFLRCSESSGRGERKYLAWMIGGFFCGISAGVKLYNLIFVVFLTVYEIFPLFNDAKQNAFTKLKAAICQIFIIGASFFVGYVFTSPIMILDHSTFVKNLITDIRKPDISSIYDILFLDRIEWDLVYSGGINHGIISVIVLCAFLMLALYSRENRRLAFSVLVSILGLIAIVAPKVSVYSWYFIPCLFFIPLLCVSSNKRYWVLLIINCFLIGDWTWFMIDNKFEQFVNIKNEAYFHEEIENVLYNYPKYTPCFFIDVGLKHYPMDSMQNETICRKQQDKRWGMMCDLKKRGKQLIFVSERARCNPVIQSLYEQAKQNSNGYTLVDAKYCINVIIHEID